MGERIVVRCHAIHRGHGAQCQRIVIGAPVTHHAHSFHRQNGGKGLPDFIIEPVFSDLVDINRIGVTQDVQFLRRDLAGATDGKSGAGERVAANESGRQTQFAAQSAHFVLEQLAQGFHQFQAHLFGQAADIVMAFDGDGGAPGKADAFDHIGIKRALRQKFGATHGVRVFLKHLDEQAANGLALDFRVGHPFERAQKQLGFVGMDQRHVVVVAEHGDDLLGLAQTQQPVIDKDAGQLFADCLMNQDRGNRGIHAARQPADHLFGTDHRADPGNRLGTVRPHGPVAFEPGQSHEIGIKCGTFGGVVHFGMELHRIKPPRRIGGYRKRRIRRGAMDGKSRSDLTDVIAVRHPDLLALLGKPAVQQRQCRAGWRDIGAAEFGGAVATLDAAAQHVHHSLLAITDAQHRHAKREHLDRRQRRAGGEHRGRTAGQDHRFGREFRQKLWRHPIERVNFAVNIQLAQAARDKLRHLAAKVDDQKPVMLRHRRGIGKSVQNCKGCTRGQAGKLSICAKMNAEAQLRRGAMSVLDLMRRIRGTVAAGNAA